MTGGNSGIGYETVYHLARKNAKVYLAARNEKKARNSIDKLCSLELPGTIEYLHLDLAWLESIRTFAAAFLARERRLDILFNSAGVMLPEMGPRTHEGYELMLGTNSLGHHYLTELLLPSLQASLAASPSNPPRVCFTSSLAHRNISDQGFTPSDPTGIHTSKPFYLPDASRAYGTSKFCNILSVKTFARDPRFAGIVFSAVHPGILRTELTRDWNRGLNAVLVPVLWRVLLYPQSYGCITQLYAATAPEAMYDNGAYFVPWARKCEPAKLANDEHVQDACKYGPVSI